MKSDVEGNNNRERDDKEGLAEKTKKRNVEQEDGFQWKTFLDDSVKNVDVVMNLMLN